MRKETIECVNLQDDRELKDLIKMIDAYAGDKMGMGKPLDNNVRERLYADLRVSKNCLALLARLEGEPIGMAVCFIGYSTFKAQPVINVHDLSVIQSQRGQGIGRRLLEHVLIYACERDFGKVTLEVRSDNFKAQALYQKLGFKSSEGDTISGMYFWEANPKFRG